jgi:hypothetical protein
MNSASLNEIKKELQQQDEATLQALCLRLAKFKKENKELLTYLLFDSQNEPGYLREVKAEMDSHFDQLTDRNLYISKKMIRKTLRIVNTCIRYSGIPQTELELRIYFCEKMRAAAVPLTPGTVLGNLYHQQVKKIDHVLNTLPEDFRGDYAAAMESLHM